MNNDQFTKLNATLGKLVDAIGKPISVPPPALIPHKLRRAEVWVRAWTAVANTNDCKSGPTATSWADKCLSDYDQRFADKT